MGHSVYLVLSHTCLLLLIITIDDDDGDDDDDDDDVMLTGCRRLVQVDDASSESYSQSIIIRSSSRSPTRTGLSASTVEVGALRGRP